MKDAFLHTMRNILGNRMRTDEPLAPRTTWQVGGPADLIVCPSTVEQLKKTVSLCRDAGVPVFVLGGGSNVLVADTGFPGAVISLADMEAVPEMDDDVLTLCGGTRLPRLAGLAVRHGLDGLAWTAGIPGTVGGALVNNAGVPGAAMTDLLEEVVLVTENGLEKTVPRGDIAAGYRSCSLKGSGVVVRARFRMERTSPADVKKAMRTFMQQRMRTQPLGRKTAGSVFKNPSENHAGELIERCGCKGWTEGGAVVSEKHANFIENRGRARAVDIQHLMDRIRDAVLKETGVHLEPEVESVG